MWVRRFLYGITLIMGIGLLISLIHPVMNHFTSFDMVKQEMKDDLAGVCTSQCCKDEALNMMFGFGKYSEEPFSCWKGYRKITLQCLQGTYCVYNKWYEKERDLFIKGDEVLSPLWYERELNG